MYIHIYIHDAGPGPRPLYDGMVCDPSGPGRAPLPVRWYGLRPDPGRPPAPPCMMGWSEPAPPLWNCGSSECLKINANAMEMNEFQYVRDLTYEGVMKDPYHHTGGGRGGRERYKFPSQNAI